MKKKFTGFLVCLLMLCMSLFAGCNLVETDNSKINILAAHADLTNRKSVYCPMKEWDFAVSGFDYVALGHIHAGGEIEKIGETYYAYSGCPEGRSFDECGVKGGIFINAEMKR